TGAPLGMEKPPTPPLGVLRPSAPPAHTNAAPPAVSPLNDAKRCAPASRSLKVSPLKSAAAREMPSSPLVWLLWPIHCELAGLPTVTPPGLVLVPYQTKIFPSLTWLVSSQKCAPTTTSPLPSPLKSAIRTALPKSAPAWSLSAYQSAVAVGSVRGTSGGV